MTMYRLITIVFALSAFVLLDLVYAQAQVVVPNSLTNTEGNFASANPYSCGPSGSQRKQQVYLGSQIGPLEIGKISYRLDEFTTAFAPTIIPGIQIDMSTTAAVPGALSTTFATNVGPDNTTVFSGDLILSAPNCTTTPCPFDIMIVLQTPFSFNPAAGNLLIDIRVPDCVTLGGGGNIPFDASANMPGIISSVFGFNVNGATGIVDIGRLVTQFESLPPQFINLSPLTATNDVSTEHTVTATVLIDGVPEGGVLVTFEVISGPNAGEMSDPDSGECTINNDCTTDVNGEVSWTYTGSQFVGTDTIVASFDGNTGIIESNTVEKIWVITRNVPTLSEWGLIAMAGILGIIGLLAIRRRKVRA